MPIPCDCGAQYGRVWSEGTIAVIGQLERDRIQSRSGSSDCARRRQCSKQPYRAAALQLAWRASFCTVSSVRTVSVPAPCPSVRTRRRRARTQLPSFASSRRSAPELSAENLRSAATVPRAWPPGPVTGERCYDLLVKSGAAPPCPAAGPLCSFRVRSSYAPDSAWLGSVPVSAVGRVRSCSPDRLQEPAAHTGRDWGMGGGCSQVTEAQAVLTLLGRCRLRFRFGTEPKITEYCNLLVAWDALRCPCFCGLGPCAYGVPHPGATLC